MPSSRLRSALYAACAVSLFAALTVAALLRSNADHRVDALLFSQVLVSADGRTLTAPVEWTPCQEVEPRLSARETASGVAVDLKAGSFADLTQQCSEADQQISVTLQAPLGARQFTEANTGWVIKPFPAARLDVVRYLPAGFTVTPHLPQVFSSSGASWEPRPFNRTATTGPAWTRFYAKAGSQPTLSITQTLTTTTATTECQQTAGYTCPPMASPSPSGSTSSQDCAPNSCDAAPFSVNGHGGRLLCNTASERAVTWADNGSVFTVVSYDPQHTALSLEEVLRIAGGMRTP